MVDNAEGGLSDATQRETVGSEWSRIDEMWQAGR